MIENQKMASCEESEQLVVFRLASEIYAVDIGAVNTIIRLQDITGIPRTPDWVVGVTNLRGSIIPVIDLRKRFAIAASEITKESRIIVVEVAEQFIGMIVDEVVETLKLSQDMIEPPSTMIASVDADYLRGIGKQEDKLVILLDTDKILSKKETESLSGLEKRAKTAQKQQSQAA